jgi:hypothetical protein
MTASEKRMEATNEWRLDNLEIVSWLFSQGDSHEFLVSMQEAIRKFGSLTEKQLEAVTKWKRTSDHRAETQKADEEISQGAPVLVAGKREFTGEILSTKWHTNDYGDSLKMTVRLIDGNKVWGTVPANIHESAEVKMPSDLHGRNISFTATLRPAPDNPHFGFFSRPSGARLI